MKYLSIDTAAVRYIEPKALRFISSSCGEVFRLTFCPLTTDHAFILVRSGKSVLVNLHFLPLNDQTRPPVMSELCRAGWLSLYPSSQSERGAEGPEHTACKDPRTPGWNRHLKVWPSPPSLQPQPTSGKCWEFQIWRDSSGCKQYHTMPRRASNDESFSFSSKINKWGKCCQILQAVQPEPSDKRIKENGIL